MARPCVICEHPERAQIDLALAHGVRPPALHEQYRNDDGIPSEGSFRRHHNSGHNQTDGAIIVRSRSELLAEAELTNEAIVAKLAVQISDAEAIQDRATENEEPTLALKAMAEARAALALIHKFAIKSEAQATGPDTSGVAIEFSALVRAMRIALPAHPEAKDAIVTLLVDAGHLELASGISTIRATLTFAA